MIYYVVPARKGSKGLPFKNRKLFQYTIGSFPHEELPNLYVTTDDSDIINQCVAKDIKHVTRPPELTHDTTPIKEVMEHFIAALRSVGIKEDDTIVLLYLTYPGREWLVVQQAQQIFVQKGLSSLLCKKQPKTSPYLCFHPEGNRGRQVIPHSLYRRQDYPSCFELSFYVCMFKVSELPNLSNNMYNDGTYFFPLEDHVDVDSELDLNKFLESHDIHNS